MLKSFLESYMKLDTLWLCHDIGCAYYALLVSLKWKIGREID